MNAPATAPVRLRAVQGSFIGTTAFFRNRAFLAQLGDEAERLAADGRRLRILVHACSIGAEAYSLAIYLKIRFPDLDFELSATDIAENFCVIATEAQFDAEVLAALSRQEAAFFDALPDGRYRVGASIRRHVQILPPQSFVTFAPDGVYDIVTISNALCYVTAAEQAAALDGAACYNSGVLAVTAFHADGIAEDLTRSGYAPVMGRFQDIHAGWTDRQKPVGGPVRLSPVVKTNPYLSPIDDGPGWQYRHGAIFQKLS